MVTDRRKGQQSLCLSSQASVPGQEAEEEDSHLGSSPSLPSYELSSACELGIKTCIEVTLRHFPVGHPWPDSHSASDFRMLSGPQIQQSDVKTN